MRTYNEILIDLKEGKKPDYEEVRLACLMADVLIFFIEKDVDNLIANPNNEMLKTFIKKNKEIRFNNKKTSPESYLVYSTLF